MAKKLGNNVWHDSVFIATTVAAIFESYVETCTASFKF